VNLRIDRRVRRPAAIVLAAAMMTGVTAGAQRRAPASEMQVKFQDADRAFADARYEDSYKQYNVVMSNGGDLAVPALKGMIRSALRLSSFQIAHQEAEALRATTTDADAFTLYGDALWADGLFDEADNAYRAAREQFPDAPRARYGIARSLMSRGQLDEALKEGLVASTALPNDPEVLVMLAQLYERLFRFDDAMQVYERYVKLLPSRIRSNSEAAALKVKLLKDFHGRKPVAMSDGDRPHTVPFTIRENKVILSGLLNGKKIDFVLDTGADQTAVTNDAADRAGLRTVVETLITGVGTPSLRKLAIGRADTLTIGDLTVHDVPVSIRRDNMPGSQPWQNETFAPAALGLSLVVDYGRHEVTLARTLPQEAAEVHLPLRLFRLPLVRGLVNEKFPAYFVVDTGGEMLSISNTKATELAMPPTRKIRLKVWGVNGIDQEAFVMPGVNLSFDAIQYRNFGVAVLNLRAPSVLLGFQLGGILGHSFLSGYRVGMDTARGELRLQKAS
jgi:predicted aspartyl protease/Flp pilus assembly protein TadD